MPSWYSPDEQFSHTTSASETEMVPFAQFLHAVVDFWSWSYVPGAQDMQGTSFSVVTLEPLSARKLALKVVPTSQVVQMSEPVRCV